jgi:hypothetical protein
MNVGIALRGHRNVPPVTVPIEVEQRGLATRGISAVDSRGFGGRRVAGDLYSGSIATVS